MSTDDASRGSFEEMVRTIARELSRSVERAVQGDADALADTIGVDPVRARQWIDGLGHWLRAQAESIGAEVALHGAEPGGVRAEVDPLRGVGPHPLDLPGEEQGLALAALDSGRWAVEPGSSALVAHGEGPGPSDALGLVRELRVRDWTAPDGEVTSVGRHALNRWLDAAGRR